MFEETKAKKFQDISQDGRLGSVLKYGTAAKPKIIRLALLQPQQSTTALSTPPALAVGRLGERRGRDKVLPYRSTFINILCMKVLLQYCTRSNIYEGI